MLKSLLLAALAAVSFTAHAAESLLARINHHGTIVVATDGAYPPFNYHDASGKLTGYDIEVTRAIAEKLGITVDFQETLWDGMLAGLKSGRFDAVANQVTLGTPERRAAFAGAIPYSWTGAMVLTRKDDNRVHDIADLKGLKAGQTLNSNHAQRAEAAGAVLVPVESLPQALTLVQQGRADLTLHDSLSMLDYLKRTPDSGLKVAWEAPRAEWEPSGLVVAKENEAALAPIDAALKALQADGTLKRLSEQFFGADVSVRDVR